MNTDAPSMVSDCVTCGKSRDEHHKTFTRTRIDGRVGRQLQSVDGHPDGCPKYLSTWDDTRARLGQCHTSGHSFPKTIGHVTTITCGITGCGMTWELTTS